MEEYESFISDMTLDESLPQDLLMKQVDEYSNSVIEKIIQIDEKTVSSSVKSGVVYFFNDAIRHSNNFFKHLYYDDVSKLSLYSHELAVNAYKIGFNYMKINLR